ncbi:MAG: HAD family phosphatase [Pseudomonadota bacterium]
MKSNVRGIVFDLGGVLVRLDSKPFFEALGYRHGKTVKACIDAIEAWTVYDRWERGFVTERQAFEAFRKWFSVPEMTIGEFRRHWNGIFPGAGPNVGRTLLRLKKKYRIYLLSNTVDTHFRYLRANFPWLRQFNRVFTSFGLGSRKPEPEIFRRMLRRIRIEPGRLIYIDDRPENVEAARKLGFRALRCPDPDHLGKLLRKHGLLP